MSIVRTGNPHIAICVPYLSCRFPFLFTWGKAVPGTWLCSVLVLDLGPDVGWYSFLAHRVPYKTARAVVVTIGGRSVFRVYLYFFLAEGYTVRKASCVIWLVL